MPAVEHRAAGQHDSRQVDCGRSHQTGRCGLVAAGGQYHTVERVAVQNFHQTHVSQVAVDGCGGSARGFLNRVNREFNGDAAGLADALSDAARVFDMRAVAG